MFQIVSLIQKRNSYRDYSCSNTGATISEDRVYDDGIEYSGASASTLELVQTPEGRAIPSAGTYNLQYELTDHLGNVRALITDVNKNGILTTDEILQKSDYYAFGRELTPTLVPSPNNNYKYNKKEFQSDLGELDYGSRFYDPVIGRWNVVDPMSEQDRRTTPYSYTFDDPIRHTDPDGIILGTGLAAAGAEVVVAAPTVVGEAVAVPAAIVTTGVTLIAAGGAVIWDAFFGNHSNNSTPVEQMPILQGASTKNRLDNNGTPNTMDTNKPGTSTKVYGPNGQVQKEYNKGHQEVHTPSNEKVDHVHDHKPNPNPGNPTKTKRMPGRAPKPNEMQKDKAKQERKQQEQQNDTNSGN